MICQGLEAFKAPEDPQGQPAAALEAMSEKIPLRRLEPGDLLFFQLGGSKANHVAIYVGGHEFVHAPSSGKRVEKLSFDHVYWGAKIRYAGRLLR